jgi:hypothetical protein
MSVVEIVQLDHWRYKINLSTDDHKHLLTLPDSYFKYYLSEVE